MVRDAVRRADTVRRSLTLGPFDRGPVTGLVTDADFVVGSRTFTSAIGSCIEPDFKHGVSRGAAGLACPGVRVTKDDSLTWPFAVTAASDTPYVTDHAKLCLTLSVTA